MQMGIVFNSIYDITANAWWWLYLSGPMTHLVPAGTGKKKPVKRAGGLGLVRAALMLFTPGAGRLFKRSGKDPGERLL